MVKFCRVARCCAACLQTADRCGRASASFKGSVAGHKELQHAISAEKNLKSASKQWMRAQAEGDRLTTVRTHVLSSVIVSQCMLRWACQEDNPAFQVSKYTGKTLEASW